MIKVIGHLEAEQIVKDRMPFGNFIETSNGIKAIANETGDAQVEHFSTLDAAVKWLSL